MRIQRPAYYLGRVAYARLRRRAAKLFAQPPSTADPVAARPESPLIVVGMHRSGTSLLTRILEDLGANMGKWQAKSTSEAYFFRQRNEAMFELAHAAWDNPEPLTRALACARWKDAFTRVAASGLGSLYSLRFAPPERLAAGFANRSGVWGFKDPRTTITLPVWLNVFPNARVVHVVRHGCAVAASLHKRAQTELNDGHVHSLVSLDVEQGLDLWAEYVLAADAYCSTLPSERFHEIRYEELLGSPEEQTRLLAGFAGLPVAEQRLKSIASRVNPARKPVRHEGNMSPRARAAFERYGYEP